MGRIAALLVASLLALPTAAHAACPGDCDGDIQVTVDELQKLVLIVLRDPPDACLAGDLDRNGRVTVEELIVAINAALVGCPPERTATPTSTPAPPTPTSTPSPSQSSTMAGL